MKFKTDFFRNYLLEAPLPLALERSLECEILSQQRFDHPVLDIGCGEGMFAHVLFDEPVDVGIDPQQSELDRAKAYGAYKELICCCGDKIPKKDGEFKTVFSNSVLEHIEGIEPVVREAHRLLAADGRFFATVPTNLFDHFSLGYQFLSGIGLQSGAEAFSRFFNRFWRHYHYFTPEGWKEMFDRNGFRVVKTWQYCPLSIGVLDDAMAFPALPSMFVKKGLNRWFISRTFRSYVTAPLLHGLFSSCVKVDPDEAAGGIIFFELEKKKGGN